MSDSNAVAYLFLTREEIGCALDCMALRQAAVVSRLAPELAEVSAALRAKLRAAAASIDSIEVTQIE